jgi:hypothetical protein
MESRCRGKEKKSWLRIETSIHSLAISLEKWVFAVPTLEILGHTISAEGLASTAEHTSAIDSCPAPQESTNCKDSSAW